MILTPNEMALIHDAEMLSIEKGQAREDAANWQRVAEAQAHELAAAKKELAAVTAQHTVCLTELKAISDALGTNEGHSSVKHIRGLKAECVTLKRKILN